MPFNTQTDVIMAGRFLRDGILESDRVNALSYAAEVFYRRLMSVVDDFGRYDARLSILRSKLYPLRVDTVSERDIQGWLDECCRVCLISVYSHNSKPYLLFHNLGEPRARKSKYPAPPESVSICAQAQADESNCTHAPTFAPPSPYALRLTPNTPLPPETGCERAPKTRRKKSPTDPQGFARFWEAYPRHAARPRAVSAWDKLSPDEPTIEAILAAIEWQRQTEQWQREGGQFIPYPATWLNARRWEDEKPVAANGTSEKFTPPVFLPNAAPMQFGNRQEPHHE